MPSFFKSSFWTFITIAIRTISALVINKVVALQFGPNGITLLSHFQNLITIASTVPNDGINRGLITYLAGKETTNENYRAYFVAGAWWQLLVWVVLITLFFTRSDFFLKAFLQDYVSFGWVLFFFVGLFLLLLSNYFQAIIIARQALNWYTGIVTIWSLGSALLIWLLLKQYALSYLLLMYLVTQGIAAIAGCILIWTKGWFPRISGQIINQQAMRDIGKFIMMALTLVVCSNLVNFYVRELMIRRFDLYQTGLWQAAVKLSDNYTMVFTSLISMVYYPKIAALISQPQAFRSFVRRVFFTLVPLVGGGLWLVYVVRRWFILLLFDEAFLPATYLLDYQVLGDFFKMSAWILSYIILAQRRVAFNIIIQVLGALLYLLLLFWFLDKFGLEGVTMAHCASFGLFFLFNIVYFRKLIF